MACGLAIFGLLNPVVGIQAYENPLNGVLPIVSPVGFKLHFIVKSLPAFAFGKAVFTVTVTASLSVQPLFGLVAVKLYVIVEDGLAVVVAAV